MPQLSAPVLENAVVRLEPLTTEHVPGIAAAAAGARDSYGYAAVPTPETAEDFVEQSLARASAGSYQPFAQLDASSGRVLGHTSYLEPRWWPGTDRLLAVEVGSTWLHPEAQGTAVNSAAKLLLFGHAFEVFGVSRVDVKTDARNARSRAGIVAVGATFEAVLRNWQPSAVPGEAGLPRDTAMHSIVAAEWPAVKARLETRIAAKAALA